MLALRQGIRTTIQHASISNNPPQEIYPANPLVLSCKQQMIALEQQTIALRSVHNISNNSHHANKNTIVFSLVATTHPSPYTFLEKSSGLNLSYVMSLGPSLIPHLATLPVAL